MGVSEPSQPSLSPSEIHRKLVELVLAGRLEEAIQIIAPNAIDHLGGRVGDRPGRAAWLEKWKTMAIPETMSIEQNVATGEYSVNRYRICGRDPRSGRPYETIGMDMVRIRNGQVVEHWAFMDGEAVRASIERD